MVLNKFSIPMLKLLMISGVLPYRTGRFDFSGKKNKPPKPK